MNATNFINSIKVAIAQDAASLITSTDAGVAVHSDKVVWYELSLTGLAALTIEQDTADGIKTKTAKLTARLCHDETLPPRAIFLLQTTDGEELLLGTPLRPHAIYAILRTFPAASSDPGGYTLSVSLTAAVPLLRYIRRPQKQ